MNWANMLASRASKTLGKVEKQRLEIRLKLQLELQIVRNFRDDGEMLSTFHRRTFPTDMGRQQWAALRLVTFWRAGQRCV